MRKLKIIATGTIAITFLSIALAAQGVGRSDIRIALQDQAGNIIVQSEIRLVASDGTEKNTHTNNDGIAEFRGLSPGKYTILVNVSGFKPYKSELITVAASETKRLDIVMQLADFETTVNVDQGEAVDMDSTGQTRSLGRQQIDELPDDPEELRRVLQRIAGESPTGEQMSITVNGVPGGQMPAKQDIKLIRVNRNVFSAQYEGTNGGGIEIFTNSGVKKLSGWLQYGISDSRWGASDPFLGVRVPNRSESFYGGIRGPLGKKTSFNVFAARFQNRSNTVVNATLLDANLRPVSFSSSFATPNRNSRINYTIDSDPNKKHKLLLGYTIFESKAEGAGVGGFTLPERGTGNQRTEHNIVFTDTYIPNPNVVNTTRFSAEISSNHNVGSITAPALNVQEAFFGGGSQTDSLAKNNRFEFYNDTTKKIKRWNLTFGMMVRGLSMSDVSRSNFGGTYTFTGRIAPVLDANNNVVKDANGNTVIAQITSLELSANIAVYVAGLHTTADQVPGGGADQFSIAGGKPDLGLKQYEFAGYGQANYSLTETIGLSFGVRYENQTNVHDWLNIAPRFGFVWQPKVKEKEAPIKVKPRITMGVGLFYSRFQINNSLNVLQANDTERSYYFITDPVVLDLFPAVPDVTSLASSTTQRSLRQIADNLQVPRQAIFNFSTTKKIWLGISVTGSYTHSESLHQNVTRNINAPLAGTYPLAPVYPLGTNRNVQEYQSGARNRADRFNLSMNLPEWKVFKGSIYMGANYSYAIYRGNSVSGSGSPNDPYDFSHEWGPNIRDHFHAFYGWFSMPLPLGFYYNANWEFDSGVRYNIYTGRDTNGDGSYSERPAYASDPNKPGVVMTPYGLLDPNPSAGDSLIPRNLGRGPVTREFDMGLSRSFGFDKNKADKNKPRKWISLRVSVNNVFNFNNKAAPVGNMASPYFLKSISGQTYGGGPGTSEQRRITFGTSFSF